MRFRGDLDRELLASDHDRELVAADRLGRA
jgi:hypothetical protein